MGSQGERRMWPSEAFAASIYDAANIALVAALVTGAVATVLIVWMGNIKEEYLRRALASVNNEAAQAHLEAEKIKKEVAWGEVTPTQSKIIRDTLQNTPMQITISWTAGDPEGSAFARRLAESFLRSGVEISAFAPMGFLGEEPHGLSISGSEQREVESLASALTGAGFGSVAVKINDRKPDGTKYFTHLQIGYRAPPSLDVRRAPTEP
jgi:hypothetical protein